METVTGAQHQIEQWAARAIAEVSRVTDCSAIVIRTSETAGALLTALAAKNFTDRASFLAGQDVCCWGRSGNLLLVLSFTGF